ncbi:MAG: MotA/TolQ/ExbB proton channel family protein [Rhodothermales bacterium]|nr:MotA/TolQ/ExbB proton channel family protein [Rhodothermales bacterium]MBO6780449.1 MotA/TolQ/ExbB proton channel family protein [Rhodothermales bacterium]
MEKSTPIGLVAGFVLIFGTIMMGQGWTTFFDVPSMIMVIGGTICGLLVATSMEDMKVSINGLKGMFGYQAPNLAELVGQFGDLARTARREGLLALDRALEDVEDEFMEFGLEMAVDGVEEEEIEELMIGKVRTEMADRTTTVKFLNNAGTFCPAFGMVGTLIGLIQMMQNLSDPAAIGAGMAVAMITTFYGAFLSNLLFLPAAQKAKAQLAEVTLAREIVQAGVLGIVRGESPSMIEKRLNLFLKDGAEAAEEGDAAMKKAA